MNSHRVEFIPYAFQLFAALLEANPSGELSEYYQSLISPILTPALWSSRGNVPALVRLLSAIIPRGTTYIIQNQQLEPLLGVFSQLVATKTNEVYGFELLEAVIASFPPSALLQYYPTILQVLLTRLQNSKTDAFALRFVRLYHFISAMTEEGLGADFFIQQLEKVQTDVFVPLYLTIILPDTAKLLRPLDRKTAVISLTKTLTDSQAFAEKYKKGWAYTCEALLKLLENPPLPPAADDNIVEQDPDDMSFGVGFTQITTIKRPPRDLKPEIKDVKSWVNAFLKEADARHGGRITTFARERLSAEAAPVFAAYMQ